MSVYFSFGFGMVQVKWLRCSLVRYYTAQYYPFSQIFKQIKRYNNKEGSSQRQHVHSGEPTSMRMMLGEVETVSGFLYRECVCIILIHLTLLLSLCVLSLAPQC